MEVATVYFSLGSNLGDRRNLLEKACSEIHSTIGNIIKISSIYKTPPFGFEASTDFFNICIECVTSLQPSDIMYIAHQIEDSLGRVREGEGYTSRTIDIDLLFYNDIVRLNSDPVIPHPSLRERLFVLFPLNEIAKDWIDPVTQKTVNQLLMECKDNSKVEIVNSQQINFE